MKAGSGLGRCGFLRSEWRLASEEEHSDQRRLTTCTSHDFFQMVSMGLRSDVLSTWNRNRDQETGGGP